MESAPTPVTVRPRDQRFADLAAVLSRAVAGGELTAAHALGVLRHQLRVMNVNGAMKVARRSEGAQVAIDHYTALGQPVPKNGSPDALHCDHVNALLASDLDRLQTSEAWLADLPRLTEVVCVTAAENYTLEKFEQQGHTGWSKYGEAGIRLKPLAGD